jgi:hypothetical protein
VPAQGNRFHLGMIAICVCGIKTKANGAGVTLRRCHFVL